MKYRFLKTLFAGLILSASSLTHAALVTHNGSDFTDAQTPAFGTLADAVGEFYIDWGVDYSYGNQEGVFNDPPAALCGINGSGVCDLLTAVDARIVGLGTTDQAFTSFVSVTAGNSAAGTLLLEVFDISMNLLGSALNPGSGASTFSVDRAGVSDIAFFRVSGDDTWGLRTVSIEAPTGAVDVPEPTSLAVLALGLLAMGSRRFAKK